MWTQCILNCSACLNAVSILVKFLHYKHLKASTIPLAKRNRQDKQLPMPRELLSPCYWPQNWGLVLSLSFYWPKTEDYYYCHAAGPRTDQHYHDHVTGPGTGLKINQHYHNHWLLLAHIQSVLSQTCYWPKNQSALSVSVSSYWPKNPWLWKFNSPWFKLKYPAAPESPKAKDQARQWHYYASSQCTWITSLLFSS